MKNKQNMKWVIANVTPPLDRTDSKCLYYMGRVKSTEEIIWINKYDSRIIFYESYEDLPKEIKSLNSTLGKNETIYLNEQGTLCGIAEIVNYEQWVMKQYIIYFLNPKTKTTPLYLSMEKSILASWNVNREMATVFEENTIPRHLTILGHKFHLISNYWKTKIPFRYVECEDENVKVKSDYCINILKVVPNSTYELKTRRFPSRLL